MLSTGMFLNLETFAWTPYQDAGSFSTESTNALFTFQGKPTIFGTNTCEQCDDDQRPHTEVLQYQPDDDTWVIIGNMLESRELHEVVQVPSSFCSFFN